MIDRQNFRVIEVMVGIFHTCRTTALGDPMLLGCRRRARGKNVSGPCLPSGPAARRCLGRLERANNFAGVDLPLLFFYF